MELSSVRIDQLLLRLLRCIAVGTAEPDYAIERITERDEEVKGHDQPVFIW
jgi:hypothetical protein